MLQLKLISAWIPTLSGLLMLVLASRSTVIASVMLAVPAVFMITGGGRLLLSPDLRGPQHVAIGSILGIVLSLPIWLLADGTLALATLGLSLAALLASGWFQIRLQPVLEEIPAPAPSLVYSARIALDNAMLGPFALLTLLPSRDELRNAVRESQSARELFADRGWLEKPSSYHCVPPAIQSVDSTPLRIRGFDCEWLRYASGYEPPTGVPGRDRWLGYSQNRTAHVLVLRHKQPAPWLICVHGFGMGKFNQDFQAFRAGQLHREAGLNIALFTLPVHGQRAPDGFNGAKFFGLSPLDFIHAESQAIWDLRQLTAWIQQQGDTRIGVHGISLGGYTSTLLSSLQDGLACVIAGVPPSDVLHTGEILASSIERRIPAAAGVDIERDRTIQRVVSPLSLTPKVEQSRRFIYAATGDQFVPIEQIRALWLHWERPKIAWCTGGHVSALMQQATRDLVNDAIATTFGSPSSQEAWQSAAHQPH